MHRASDTPKCICWEYQTDAKFCWFSFLATLKDVVVRVFCDLIKVKILQWVVLVYFIFCTSIVHIWLVLLFVAMEKWCFFFGLNAFYFSFLIIAVVDEYSEVVFSILSVLSVSSLNWLSLVVSSLDFLINCWPFLYFIIAQAITSSGTKKGELFLADVNTQLKNKNITTDLKVDTASNVSFIGL